MDAGRRAGGQGDRMAAKNIPPYTSNRPLPYGPNEYRQEIDRVRRSRRTWIVLVIVIVVLLVAAIAAVTLFGVRLPF